MRKTYSAILLLTVLTLGVCATLGAVYLTDKVAAGQVVDGDTGQPVAGAAVRLGQSSALTGADGRFSLAGGQRPQRLTVEAPGYYPQVRPVEWPWWQKQVATDLPLQATRLSGSVLDAWSGQPVAGAVLRARSAPGGDSLAASDTAGRFVLTRLALPAELAVEAPGYLAWTGAITDLHALAPSLHSGQALGASQQVALTPNTVSGTLRAADSGEPLAGAAISLGGQTATTDTLGRFQLHGVAPGTTLHVAPPPIFLPSDIVYSGEGQLDAAVEPRRLVVVARDSLTGVLLPDTLVQAGAISRTTTAEGAALTRLAPGARLLLTREGYLASEATYSGEPAMEVSMRPYALQGVLRDRESGQPVPSATLYVGDQILKTDEAGSFRIPKLPGDPSQASGQAPLIAVKASGFRVGSLSLTDQAGTSAALDLDAQPCDPAPSAPGPPCLDLGLTPFQARGIYIPFGLLSQPDTVHELLDLIDRTGLNALVVDVKGDRGNLAYASQIPLAIELGVSGEREGWLTLEELLAETRARGIYTIARIVVFKDHPLAVGRPEFAVQYADGTLWTDGEGLGWGNPFREEVWEYNIAIAQEVAELGFDEVQFDYLRFPSDGDIGAIAYVEENSAETRTAAIREFTRRVSEALQPYRVFTSADVFGLTVWVEPESDMSIGQRVMDIAPLVDYLCPMLYPSTFRSGNLGYADPSAHPYDVIYRSQEAATGRVPASTRVRPWLQAYWYTLDEMLLQKQAAEDAGAAGWTFWNAGGSYDEGLFGGP